ncbi:hypothetical protein C2G38_2227303 [Gigaspora rosea]|uniref:BTB domain-containing protein n=1 Tax=Gigaspora rosea TaxID=44941 RepID=A0A397U5E1_9GLOM|nr:hypothetical protein C2G38_2227303 [Gigaspora rosea]
MDFSTCTGRRPFDYYKFNQNLQGKLKLDLRIFTRAIKFFEKLSNNYLELLDDKEDFNIIINDNIKTLNLKHVYIQHFEVIIKYVYRGIASSNFELMLIVYQFLLDESDKQIQTHLIEKKAYWLRLYFNRTHQKVFEMKIYKNGVMILW